MDIHVYMIHGYIHVWARPIRVWISDFIGHAVDISMDIMLAHLLIRLIIYMLYFSACLSV